MEPKVIQLMPPTRKTWLEYRDANVRSDRPTFVERLRVEAFGLTDEGLVVPMLADEGTLIPADGYAESWAIHILGINSKPEDEWQMEEQKRRDTEAQYFKKEEAAASAG